MTTAPAPPAGPPDIDPLRLLRSKHYLVLLLMGAVIGVPVAAIAYFFLAGIDKLQTYVFETLPADVGFEQAPTWWPIPPLVLSGILVALTIRYLPGIGGHKPAEGFKPGTVAPIELPGVVLAAFATLGLGVVLGPEAPLIALGGGLGVLAMHLVKRDAPAQAALVVGGAGSFAAISTLLGSPIVGAFLLMEAGGLGGVMMRVVLVPGLLAAGIGSLIFVGLDSWSGLGTFSLAVPDIPVFNTPTGAQFLWAIGIGLGAALLGVAIRRGALFLQDVVERRMLLLTPLVGLGIAGLAIAYAEGSDRDATDVLFSGQSALAPLIEDAASWTVEALVLLVACKGLAYMLALSSFRGGPVFPGMFIGAAAGVALSHLPGLPLIAGVAMGIGAMTVTMLGLPLTSVLLTVLFLQADGLALMPLVIVAVVVAYVASARLMPAPAAPAGTAPAPGTPAEP